MPEQAIRSAIQEEFKKNENASGVTGLMLWKVVAGFFLLMNGAIGTMYWRSERSHDHTEAYLEKKLDEKDQALTQALLDSKKQGEMFFDYYDREVKMNRITAEQNFDTLKRNQAVIYKKVTRK